MKKESRVSENHEILKREAVEDILNKKAKLLQQFSLHPMDQQESPCCHNFLTVTQSYHSSVTPVGTLHVEKISASFLLYIFGIKVTASLFGDHGSLQFLLRWPQSIYQIKGPGPRWDHIFFPLLHRLHCGKTDY